MITSFVFAGVGIKHITSPYYLTDRTHSDPPAASRAALFSDLSADLAWLGVHEQVAKWFSAVELGEFAVVVFVLF